jgi:chromosome segregation ATPase
MMRNMNQLGGDYDREANGELRFLTETLEVTEARITSYSETLAELRKEKDDLERRRVDLETRLRSL